MLRIPLEVLRDSKKADLALLASLLERGHELGNTVFVVVGGDAVQLRSQATQVAIDSEWISRNKFLI